MNAIQNELQYAVRKHAARVQREGMQPFIRVPAPPDGLCAYHCVVGSLTYERWSEVQRYDNGMAKHPRIEQSESATARRLRDIALQETPEDDVVIAEQAFEAQQSTTLDVGELSWLGQSLNLSIRCYIADEAGLFKTWATVTITIRVLNFRATVLWYSNVYGVPGATVRSGNARYSAAGGWWWRSICGAWLASSCQARRLWLIATVECSLLQSRY